jgi:agmatinase
LPTGLKINCNDPSAADVVILCAPYDRTASFRKGAVNGPAKIVNSLKYQMESYDRFSGAMPSPERKVGISLLKNLNRYSPPIMVDRVKKEYGKYLARGAFVLMLGGEHSVTTGALQALASQHDPKKITVCQVDAHLDLRPDDTD